MTECEAQGLQGRFQVRTQDARLDSSGARHLVDLKDGVQVVQINSDRSIRIARHVHAPNHRRAPAVGNHHVALLVAPRQRRFQFIFATRMGNRVWRMIKVAPQGFQQFQRVTAVGVRNALRRRGRHPIR